MQAPLGEAYPVTRGRREDAIFLVDRGAASWFGFRAFGQHLNGYVRRGEELFMWVGKRAGDRRIFPGRLDQLVAGGLPQRHLAGGQYGQGMFTRKPASVPNWQRWRNLWGA